MDIQSTLMIQTIKVIQVKFKFIILCPPPPTTKMMFMTHMGFILLVWPLHFLEGMIFSELFITPGLWLYVFVPVCLSVNIF